MASPSAMPTTRSSTVDAVPDPDRRAVKFMAIRQRKATMNQTKVQPCDGCRPRQAARAKKPAVTATYPMVCPNRVRVRS